MGGYEKSAAVSVRFAGEKREKLAFPSKRSPENRTSLPVEGGYTRCTTSSARNSMVPASSTRTGATFFTHLFNLFNLRARERQVVRHVRLPRPRTKGPRRGWPPPPPWIGCGITTGTTPHPRHRTPVAVMERTGPDRASLLRSRFEGETFVARNHAERRQGLRYRRHFWRVFG